MALLALTPPTLPPHPPLCPARGPWFETRVQASQSAVSRVVWRKWVGGRTGRGRARRWRGEINSGSHVGRFSPPALRSRRPVSTSARSTTAPLHSHPRKQNPPPLGNAFIHMSIHSSVCPSHVNTIKLDDYLACTIYIFEKLFSSNSFRKCLSVDLHVSIHLVFIIHSSTFYL